jgi:hypothetical protein
MTVTKFNHLTPPSFVREGEFTTGVLAWWVSITENGGANEYRLFDGDYIICDDNGVCIKYISVAEYASDLVLRNLLREAVGKILIRNIWAALLASALSDTQKGGVATTISPVLVMVLTGEIVAGRTLANSTATNANYTAGVKTALLALMDTQIAIL